MKGETNAWLKQGDTLVKRSNMQGLVVGYSYTPAKKAKLFGFLSLIKKVKLDILWRL